MMMLNLFIAVVLEGFSSTNKEHTGVVTSEDYNMFVEKWLQFDPEATGWIKLENVVFLCCQLEQPLGQKFAMDENLDDFITEVET